MVTSYNSTLIIRPMIKTSPSSMEVLRDRLVEGLKDGVVIIPDWCEYEVVTTPKMIVREEFNG